MFCFNKKKKPDYVKIGAIILSAALSACIVAYVVYKLCCKYADKIAAAKIALLDKIDAVKCKFAKKDCLIEEIDELEDLEAADCDVTIEVADETEEAAAEF